MVFFSVFFLFLLSFRTLRPFKSTFGLKSLESWPTHQSIKRLDGRRKQNLTFRSFLKYGLHADDKQSSQLLNIHSLFEYSIYSWGIKGFNTPQSVCSKTTLIASSVSEAGMNPPFCKMGTFFLRSLALSIPIYRNFQSNGGKWRSLKLRNFFFV